MSSVLIREHLEDVRRWDMPDVSGRNPIAPTTIQPTRTVRQLADLERQVRAEAFARGLAEGHETAARELAVQVAHLQSIIGLLSQPLAELDHRIEHDLVVLATRLATQVVRHELEIHPEQITPLVRTALSALPISARHIKVYLHPDDAEIVRAELPSHDHANSWQIIDDPKITRGGCRVTSETSSIDATLESRLDAAINSALEVSAEHVNNGGQTP